MIKVLFFGPVADRVGSNALQMEYRADMSLQNLRDDCAAKYSQAFELVSMVALNGEHARDMFVVLNDGDEVAFMAKFSGG
ncbi:MAG: MoaD/ThiS family protein [Gallionellaceae bacterium]|nr:MoaD/ThiS family protein [Gallionellaceae bacterium]